MSFDDPYWVSLSYPRTTKVIAILTVDCIKPGTLIQISHYSGQWDLSDKSIWRECAIHSPLGNQMPVFPPRKGRQIKWQQAHCDPGSSWQSEDMWGVSHMQKTSPRSESCMCARHNEPSTCYGEILPYYQSLFRHRQMPESSSKYAENYELGSWNPSCKITPFPP